MMFKQICSLYFVRLQVRVASWDQRVRCAYISHMTAYLQYTMRLRFELRLRSGIMLGGGGGSLSQ